MKIVLINFGGIGDEILFLPVIDSLKKKYPTAKINLVLEPRSKSIKELSSNIDSTIECDIKSRNKFLEVIKLILRLRKERYDMIISSGGSPLISIILSLSGIKKRYGYDTGLLSKILLTKTSKLNKQQYAANMYHDLISELIEENPSEVHPNLMIKNSLQTDPMKEKIKIPADKKVVLIHPGSSKLSKQKNIIKNYENWNEVIEKLKEKYTVILVGGPDDEDVIKNIDKNEVINFFGKTRNIKDLAILMRKADMILCIDSAPMHMAVALNKPLVAIFGPTDEKKLLPNSEKFVAITTHSSCRPCLWDRRNECCETPSCLDISADKVLSATEQLLKAEG